MTSSLRAFQISEPREYIHRASETQSFQTLTSELHQHVDQIEKKDQSAIRLLDSNTGRNAIRTEHTFQVSGEGKYPSATADIQVLLSGSEKIDGVGYLRDGNRLLMEFSTNESIAPDCHVESYGGDVILEKRDFERVE